MHSLAENHSSVPITQGTQHCLYSLHSLHILSFRYTHIELKVSFKKTGRFRQ